MSDRAPTPLTNLRSKTFLVGAGVVGQAILRSHVDACVSVCLADQDESAVIGAIDRLGLAKADWEASPACSLGDDLYAMEVVHLGNGFNEQPRIVIESIAERLAVKQTFFADAEELFGAEAILCSNTSTLRIDDIASKFVHPERFCGMHFFMPVNRRSAVEVVRGSHTSDLTIDRVSQHVQRINKSTLVVSDGPGFAVNRLLSPYLNEAMLLLSRGVSADQIERAALSYGMPMSPLELMDWIGTRTVFDAGRAFWQAYPDRMDPSPIAPALLKRKRFGRTSNAGFYDYSDGKRSQELSPLVSELAESYCRERTALSDGEVQQLLSIPMWIEAALAARDGIVTSSEQFETAMKGGLGFDIGKSWIGCFDSLGSEAICEADDRWGGITASMKIPDAIRQLLQESSPSDVLLRSLQ